MKIICVIPARLESKRFSRKMLTHLVGKPLLQHVWNAASTCPLFNEVYFAIDALETAQVINTFNGKFFMTPVECNSGTERIAYLVKNKIIHGDIFVNWQGDEPFITHQMIEELLQEVTTADADVWTLKKRITDPTELYSKSVAKVVCNQQDKALYFSRSPIPGVRDEEDFSRQLEQYPFFKHIGLYAFTKRALKNLYTHPTVSILEDAEKLEQIRFLEQGLTIKAFQTETEVFGIDFPSDLLRAEKRLEI